ncbi:ABC transporter permease [Thiohalobacter sp. IOR34]|uniref:ABC transporter permease n=1 Tax=Thiohalobacter sp. IOR34 TaxID=3057176 RepID=UPI0025B17DD2|nr:ABC transporter permease [Thiohalobacter sp. IOR34]WJW75340.1 ABC transporter permease [Thiohalobacter sp. IOR34]
MRNSLAHILALALKEFLALLRDKRSRIVIIVPPIVQLFVFGFAASYDLNEVPVAVYDEDRGGAARELLARIEGSPNFSVLQHIGSDAEIAPLIDGRRVLLVVHLGPRFSADLARGETAPLQVIIDGRNSNTAMTALNYLRSLVLDFNRAWQQAQGQTGPPVKLQMRAWYNENLQSQWFIVPGIVGSLMLVVTLLVTALSVAREREQGTFDQLLVTPLRPVEILIGKAIPGMVIGLLEATLIVALMTWFFDIPLRGSIPALYLGILLFLLATVGIGLMISAIALTQQQAILGAFLFIVPAVILSGFTTPIANMPEPVQWLTYLDPLRYFLVIVRGVTLEGDGFALLFHQFWPMALIGAITLAMAGWLFRHRMY